MFNLVIGDDEGWKGIVDLELVLLVYISLLERFYLMFIMYIIFGIWVSGGII